MRLVVLKTAAIALMLLPIALIVIVFIANIRGQAGLATIRIAGGCLTAGFVLSLLVDREGKPSIETRLLYVVLTAICLLIVGPVIQAAGAARESAAHRGR